jgi:hypothetical protein
MPSPSSAPELIRESDALHARVIRFVDEASDESFDSLALAIAEYQARFSRGHAKLRQLHGTPTSVDRIPGVPADAFRATRVAVHAPEDDVARFVTSGTSAGSRGTHAFRTTSTYESILLRSGEAALEDRRRLVLALAPDPGTPEQSSLGFMLRRFMHRFDGTQERWLFGSNGLDLDGLQAAIREARASGRDVLFLATSFALVELLDRRATLELALPEDSVVMQTGGFKGRTRELDPARLRQEVAACFGIPDRNIVSEYGMTELTSQLYDFTLRGGTPGQYRPPPWLRVSAVDPATLDPLPAGEVGLARFVDLGNVDSAVAVVTQDRVRVTMDGIELLGRQPGALPRGCSLAIEELVLQARENPG